ncbi:MAG: hypothetical protein OHK0017_08930 [Patescibacteria group bacterium]
MQLSFTVFRHFNDDLGSNLQEEDADEMDMDFEPRRVSIKDDLLAESGVEDEEEYYDEGDDQVEDEEALNNNFIIEG